MGVATAPCMGVATAPWEWLLVATAPWRWLLLHGGDYCFMGVATAPCICHAQLIVVKCALFKIDHLQVE